MQNPSHPPVHCSLHSPLPIISRTYISDTTLEGQVSTHCAKTQQKLVISYHFPFRIHRFHYYAGNPHYYIHSLQILYFLPSLQIPQWKAHTQHTSIQISVYISRRPFRGRAASLTDWAHLNKQSYNTPRLKEPHGRTWQTKHAISYSCYYLSLEWQPSHNWLCVTSSTQLHKHLSL